ncbi:MAG: hypothetical protein ACFFFH_13460 [Candidatus Thorarchaeota archaeon]
MPHVGLVAPDPVFSGFRESGILYLPIQEGDNPEEIHRSTFNKMAEIFLQELNKEGKRFEATWFDNNITLFGVECLTHHFQITFPEYLASIGIFTGFDFEYFNPSSPTDPPSCVVFFYQNRAIVAAWAVYPPNVITIMKAILGIDD